jgi:hypothetical protein
MKNLKMLKLDNITLIAVSSIRINETIYALLESSRNIQFNSIKLVSHWCPKDLPDNIFFEECLNIDSIDKYSRYIMFDLIKHVQTDFCLLIQHDGYVLRPEKWDNVFLNYDYIGAPWPIKDNAYRTTTGEHVRVGNGGFSLRSRKLLEVPIKYNIPFLQEQGFYNEDGNLCVYNRADLLELGIKYAPIDIAAKFSHETTLEEFKDIKPFGFHRYKK